MRGRCGSGPVTGWDPGGPQPLLILLRGAGWMPWPRPPQPRPRWVGWKPWFPGPRAPGRDSTLSDVFPVHPRREPRVRSEDRRLLAQTGVLISEFYGEISHEPVFLKVQF